MPRSDFQQARLRRRLLTHHLPLLALSSIAIWALYITRPYPDPLSRLSFATAYPALLLIAATLLIGPWLTLTNRRTPASLDLRRDLGIWSGILALLHTVVGQNVHLRGRPWLYYVYEHRERHLIPLRHDVFGLANHTGALAALLVLALLATSNDASLRLLGTPQWKRLQRWNYAAFALVAIHTFAYLSIEKLNLPFLAFAILSTVTTIALQLAGARKRAAQLRASPPVAAAHSQSPTPN